LQEEPLYANALHDVDPDALWLGAESEEEDEGPCNVFHDTRDMVSVWNVVVSLR
jgi:hypothetical protein